MSLEVVGFSDELEGFESDVDSEAGFSLFEAGQAGDMAAIGEAHGYGQSESGEASESSSDSDLMRMMGMIFYQIRGHV